MYRLREFSLYFFSRIFFGVLLISSCKAARKWEYEPISLATHTSDPNLITVEAKIDRLGRGDFAISANAYWKYDTSPETMVEATVFRSTSGDEADYKQLPWTIPKQTFYDYLSTHYKDLIMNNFHHCSNLPHFEGNFQPPWEKKTYIASKCKIGDAEGLPEIAPPGFYKIVFSTFGPDQPTWGFTAIFKLTAKMF